MPTKKLSHCVLAIRNRRNNINLNNSMIDYKKYLMRSVFLVVGIVLFCNVCLFISCAENEFVPNVVFADLNKAKPLSDADIIDSVDIISLQGTDQWIQRIDKVVEFDSLLYVMDQRNKALYVFSQTGRHLSTISNVGHAANEYIEIDDFFIDKQDGSINILSSLDKKILKYNGDGTKLLEVKTIPMSFRRILCYDSGYVGFMGNCSEDGKSSHNFWVMDKDFRVLNSYIDINPNLEGMFHGDISTFAEHDDKLFFFSDSSRDVYRLNDINSKPSLAFTLDCGDANPPQLSASDYADWQRVFEVSNKYVMDICYFQETDNCVMFYYLYQGNYYLTVQDKSGKEAQTYKLDVYTGDYLFEFGRVVAMADEAIYTSVEAQSVYYPWKGGFESMNYEKEYPQQVNNIRRKLQNINPDGNPFVVKYYISKCLR